MKRFLQKIIWISLISFYFLQIAKVKAIVPYYYFPTIKNLEKQSLYIGKNAYQLLYFGQYEDSLNLAKLAVKINAKDEKLLAKYISPIFELICSAFFREFNAFLYCSLAICASAKINHIFSSFGLIFIANLAKLRLSSYCPKKSS